MTRELIRISSDIQKKAYDEKQDVDELMQDAEGQLFEITQRNLKKDVTHIQPVISKAIDLIEIAANKQDGYTGIPSGFNGIDAITSGWQKSDLIIIAARPAMGKTAFVLSMAKNMALDYEHPVAVFSLEMSNIQLVNRLIVNVAEIEGDKIKRGKLAPFEWEQLRLRTATLQKAPIFVDDTPSLSVFELRTNENPNDRPLRIGQIIFDPNGEYANENVQDNNSALKNVAEGAIAGAAKAAGKSLTTAAIGSGLKAGAKGALSSMGSASGIAGLANAGI